MRKCIDALCMNIVYLFIFIIFHNMNKFCFCRVRHIRALGSLFEWTNSSCDTPGDNPVANNLPKILATLGPAVCSEVR